MQNMDNSIAEMYSRGYIDREDAITRSNNPGKMEKLLSPMEGTHFTKGGKVVSDGSEEAVQPSKGASIL